MPQNHTNVFNGIISKVCYHTHSKSLNIEILVTINRAPLNQRTNNMKNFYESIP